MKPFGLAGQGGAWIVTVASIAYVALAVAPRFAFGR